MKTLDSFRAGSVQLLVASDVAARGLDIPAVSHVFNYDVPHHADDYVHRVGRTGRAGRQGFAFMLVGPADAKYLGAIEKLTGKTLDREDMTDLEVAPDNRERRSDRDRDGKRGGRDRDRSRRGRDRGHRGDKPYHDEVASMAPVDAAALTVVEPPAEQAAAPREDKPHRERHPRREGRGDNRQRDRGPRKQEPARAEARHGGDRPKQDKPRHEKPAPEKRRHREDRDDGAPSGPGMGANTPAFLLRPVPQHLLKRKKESEPV
jgi:superfamily II DNA/RNA helicase